MSQKVSLRENAMCTDRLIERETEGEESVLVHSTACVSVCSAGRCANGTSGRASHLTSGQPTTAKQKFEVTGPSTSSGVTTRPDDRTTVSSFLNFCSTRPSSTLDEQSNVTPNPTQSDQIRRGKEREYTGRSRQGHTGHKPRVNGQQQHHPHALVST